MSWRGIDGGNAAASSGHDVVMTPTSNCYFDYYQGLTGEPVAIGNYLPLDRVYSYEPVPPGLTKEEARRILGAQGNVWTEYMADARKVEYMTFPRACAMSEVVWSPSGKRDFRDFSARMAGQYERLLARGVNVRIPPPGGFEGSAVFFRDTSITLVSQVPGSVVRYTTDGEDPTAVSRILTGPLPLHTSTRIKARTFLPSGGMSPVPSGVFSIVDPGANGVSYRIAARPTSPGLASDTLRGVTYRMSLEGLPLGPESVTILLDSYLLVGEEGVYQFTIAQEDSATLNIDGSPLLENRAAVGWGVPAGLFHLRSGSHKLSVTVVTMGRQAGLDLNIKGPGLELQAIPASMLWRRPR
jgi:hexosaminidase